MEQNILYSIGKEGASNLVSLLSKSLEPEVNMHNNDRVICSCGISNAQNTFSILSVKLFIYPSFILHDSYVSDWGRCILREHTNIHCIYMMVYELRGPLIEPPPPPQSNLETCIRSLNTPNSSFRRLENSRNIVNIKF